MAECVAAIWNMMDAFSYASDVCVVSLFVNASCQGKFTLISANRSSSSSSCPKYLYNKSLAVRINVRESFSTVTTTNRNEENTKPTSHLTPSTPHRILSTSLQCCTFSSIIIWILAIRLRDEVTYRSRPINLLSHLLRN